MYAHMHTCTHAHTHTHMQISQLGEESSGSSQSSGESTPCSIEVAEPAAVAKPQRKRFRHLERVLEQKWKGGSSKEVKTSTWARRG